MLSVIIMNHGCRIIASAHASIRAKMGNSALLLIFVGFFAVPHLTGAQSELADDYADAVGRLRVIGAALSQYAADNPTNVWPDRLTNLVSQGYLIGSNLLCEADYSGGTEGGVPDSFANQFAEVDEDGCSFLYEFTEAEVSWG